jgi:hypothetical protein
VHIPKLCLPTNQQRGHVAAQYIVRDIGIFRIPEGSSKRSRIDSPDPCGEAGQVLRRHPKETAQPLNHCTPVQERRDEKTPAFNSSAMRLGTTATVDTSPLDSLGMPSRITYAASPPSDRPTRCARPFAVRLLISAATRQLNQTGTSKEVPGCPPVREDQEPGSGTGPRTRDIESSHIADVVPDPWRKAIAVHSGGPASRAISVFISRNIPPSNAFIARLHHTREA